MKFDQYTELRSVGEGIIGYGLSRRTSQLLKLVDRFVAEDGVEALKVIDFGCYDGAMMAKLANRYKSIFTKAVGLDIFPHGVPEDELHGAIRFIKLDLWKEIPYPLEDGDYNLLVASAFFKHHRSPEPFLKECFRLLQKHGVLIMLDPCPWVVQVGMKFKYFVKEDNPNPWSKRSVEVMIENTGLKDNFVICDYERYWVAPNKKLFDLGIESWIPNFLIRRFGLHQSIVIKKV